MQKKIFRIMTLTSTLVLIVFAVIIGRISYISNKNAAQNELKSVAKIIVQQELEVEQIDQYLKNALQYDVRLTYIDKNGNVIYDNTTDAVNLENHFDREEVKKALEENIGESTHFSNAIDKTTYYYAVKYGDGVLRFARERSSLISFFLNLLPILISLTGILIVVTAIISVKLSECIIKPLNRLVREIDADNQSLGNYNPEYEELIPIAENVNMLLKRINKNINKLKREKEKITLITDNMVEGMILLDSDYSVLSVNRSAAKLLKLSPDQYNHKKITQMTINEKLLELLHSLNEKDSVRGVIEAESRFFRVFINKSDHNGEYGIIILLVDVTEIIQNEEIRRDFSANVSHELKTPLTTIKGFGEMLENGIITSPDDIKKYGGTIYRESERLLLLINDIIRLSEIEEHTSEETERINVLETAKDVQEFLQNKADKHNVTLDVSGDPAEIEGNCNYITELLLNLTDNAIKYNNDGGNVWLKVIDNKNEVVISVKDNGIGIGTEDQGRIFERFYRVDKSRSKETGGTGLGLSIVKHIVAYHHGSIDIKSEINKGTEITVILPKCFI